jgi:ABC-2 type transport system permease protein
LTSLRGRPGGFTTSTDRSGVVERVRRVWAYRRILALLISRDLKVRYAGSALGYVWSILDPLLMSAVYWVVFTKIFTRSVGYEPYIVFLLCGQLPWQWFNLGVTSAARALRTDAQMVRSTNVPRELWIVRNVASSGVQYLLSLPVLAAFAIATHAAPNIDILLMPLAILLQTVLLIGIGLCLAPVTVLVRDVERLIRIALRIGFYVSPVLYSVNDAKRLKKLHDVFSWNPMAGILTLYRSAFFPQELHWNYVFHSSIVCSATLAVGLFVFARLERPVLKEL